jgi:hypothetical protein
MPVTIKKPMSEKEHSQGAAGPVFVVGAPRSGTSMLHWALVQHQKLWGGTESDFLEPLIHGADAAWRSGTRAGELHWLSKEDVSRPEFLRYLGRGIDEMFRSRSGGLRWIDQTPRYVLHYASLGAMFPGARFIHIIRDGRQVATSMQEKFGWPFMKAVTRWKQLAGAGQAIARQGNDDFLQVRFESLIREPETEFRKIYKFLGEAFEAESVRFLSQPINTAPGREQETSLQKLEPRWRHWGWHKRTFFRITCGDLMSDLGYSQ